MASVKEIMRLCRLCLVKDEVNTPIFDEQGDIRQIFLKISACLPVKVSREDNLPKNICDGCSSKLELLYQFWNTSANSEKKLIQWLGAERSERNAQHSMIDPVVLKQEVVEVPDERTSPDHLDDLNVSNDTDYLQQQLPYENVEFQFQQDDYDDTGTDAVVESPPVSRKRRAAAIRAMAKIGSEDEANSEDEGNPDLLEPKLAKIEEESEESGGEDPEPTAFVGLPSANDNDQPGPSGVGKSSVDSPGLVLADMLEVQLRTSRDSSSSSPEWKPKLRERKFACTICGESFNHLKLLIDHANDVHDGEYRHKCEECRTAFSSKRTLRAHRKEVHPAGPYKCAECEKVFQIESVFKKHQETHLISPEDLTCHRCDRRYASLTLLKSHERKVHRRNYYTCDTCGKQIADPQNFQNHLRVHMGEKPFECSYCEKRFTNEKLLRIHERVHNGEKPYACDLCDKRFTQRSSLTVHLRRHAGEKPYVCPVCEKSFASKSNLNAHVKTHK